MFWNLVNLVKDYQKGETTLTQHKLLHTIEEYYGLEAINTEQYNHLMGIIGESKIA